MTIGIIFLACIGFTAGFLIADIQNANVETQAVMVATKYAPNIRRYDNLVWWIDHSKYGLIVKLYDGSCICVGVSSGFWNSTTVGDKCQLKIKRGRVTGIVWDYKIVGKIY